MSERIETQTSQSADHAPEYADITPRMIEQATATGNLFDQSENAIRSQRSIPDAGGSQLARRTAAYGDAYGPSDRERAFHIVKGAESRNPDINMDAFNRVSEMIGDAVMEDRARDTVKSGGKVHLNGLPAREYVPGTHKTASNDESVPDRPKWDAESVSTYSIGNDGKARKINQRPGAPQHMEPVTARHEFSPEHQERARELIQSLADKQSERYDASNRQAEVIRAQDLIDKANAPRQEIDRAA